jgi:hypothetical protein
MLSIRVAHMLTNFACTLATEEEIVEICCPTVVPAIAPGDILKEFSRADMAGDLRRPWVSFSSVATLFKATTT